MTQPPPSKVVLVVEDDPSVCDLIVRAIKTKGHVVHEANDGSAALRMLGSFERLPDLVICDVMMPGVDGFSLARLMRERAELREVPLIFLTARTEAKDLVRGINLGARHYVQKPFKLKDLMDKVEKCLR